MRVAVCVRPSLSGELGPFDAAAYETALRIAGAEVTLLAMAPQKSEELLLRLTRLGAKEAVLLSDRAFAGADTLATTYTLSLALKTLSPDLVLCGRQTVEGDTAQVPPGLAARLGCAYFGGAMTLSATADAVTVTDRRGEEKTLSYPALVAVERIASLRLPSIFSRPTAVRVLDADALGADRAKCGLAGSPTQVRASHEATGDRRRCRFVSPADFERIFAECLAAERDGTAPARSSERLSRVWCVGEAPRAMAETVSDDITVVPLADADSMARRIAAERPNAVLWDSSPAQKECAARVAVLLGLGLCADCTALVTDGKTLRMVRPAFGGNVIAEIESRVTPAMATVRTAEPDGERVLFGFGVGVEQELDAAKAFAARHGAVPVASRLLVDRGAMPYEAQIGLTGRTVSPQVYVAVGISGAVHHIAGMKGACRVIAVNPDRNAPIFDYADFGIVAPFASLL